MIIAEIGENFSSTQKIDYYSNNALVEYDAIIIDISKVIENARKNRLSYEMIELRRNQFFEFIIHKKMPIIYFMPQITQKHFIIDGSTQIESITTFFPIVNFSTIKETGNKIQIIPKTIFTEFLKKYEFNLKYDSYIDFEIGTKIAETIHTKKTLAFYDSNSIFLPSLKNKLSNENTFLIDLFSISQSLYKNDHVAELPSWANSYYIPKELETYSKIAEIQKKIENLFLELETKEEEILEYKKIKGLFTGTGDELEAQVQILFYKLGFEILETESNRDDLIVKYRDKIAVIEIKGVTKSSAEKHAAQLEKWVALYLEKEEVAPKGILIVNAFKDLPINERNEDAFPHQMLSYATKRDHCLITSLQLMTLYYAVINGDIEKEEAINSLYETVGIYQGANNWDKYIEYKPSKNES